MRICSEAACSTGYSPFLSFDIQDLSDTIPRLLMMGAIMDGPIKYPAHGKVRSIGYVGACVYGLSCRLLITLWLRGLCRWRRCARPMVS